MKLFMEINEVQKHRGILLIRKCTNGWPLEFLRQTRMGNEYNTLQYALKYTMVMKQNSLLAYISHVLNFNLKNFFTAID